MFSMCLLTAENKPPETISTVKVSELVMPESKLSDVVDCFVYKSNSWSKSDACTSAREGTYILVPFDSLNGRLHVFTHDPKKELVSRILTESRVWEVTVGKVIDFYLKRAGDINLIDIGGNIGIHSLQAAGSGRKVIAMEALKTNIQHMCASIKYNNLQDNMKLVYNAVGDTHEPSIMSFEAKQNAFGYVGSDPTIEKRKHAEEPQHTWHRVNVPTVLLNDLLVLDYFKSFKRVFMKLDVEGAENHVFNGSREFFRKVDVVGIVMEWRWHRERPESAKLIKDMLFDLSYEAYSFPGYSKAQIVNPKAFRPLRNIPYQKWPHDIIWDRKKYT